jgi:type I restriction enzyme, S subunit
MTESWPSRRLIDIADVRVSNVDKKIHAAENPVRLCNYMDVYSNEYVTNTLDFMEGSATSAEIERFSLRYGDVIITKDSETPDDIGIPAVISELVDKLVCGYHLALIRPKVTEVDSVYLAKQLSTARVARYFALQASGSTRYGLPISAIESVDIPTPPKPEQAKIAEILSTVDRAIEQTEALIAKQQRIKTGLMQDLLTRGIDKHGNLRSESTHKFKDSALGRIPVEWEVKRIGEVARSLVPGRDKPDLDGGGIPWITIPDIDELYCGSSKNAHSLSMKSIKASNARLLPPNTVLMSCVGEFGIAAVAEKHLVANQQLHGFICDETILPEWLAIQILHSSGRIDRLATQTTIKYLNKTGCESIEIAAPQRVEQEQGFKLLGGVIGYLSSQKRQVAKLRSLRTALMQDLLTGKKRVTSLLELDTVIEES